MVPAIPGVLPACQLGAARRPPDKTTDEHDKPSNEPDLAGCQNRDPELVVEPRKNSEERAADNGADPDPGSELAVRAWIRIERQAAGERIDLQSAYVNNR